MNSTDIRGTVQQIWSQFKTQVTSYWFGGSREEMGWGYDDKNGPDTWCQNFPHASGSHQSPVNIVTSTTNHDPNLHPLGPTYAPGDCKSLVNTGNGFQVKIESQGTNYQRDGFEYRLLQFHFHWGATSKDGSEHTINGVSYASELHLVHWNFSKYKTAAEAVDKPDGLAVIGVFIKVGKQNADFQKLCDYLSKIRYKDQSVDLQDGFDVMQLLPRNLRDYWTYPGSLTTPPCFESVRWIVLKEPIEFSEQQLEAFRQLEHVTEEEASAGDHAKCTRNFRPTMPLNERKISASF